MKARKAEMNIVKMKKMETSEKDEKSSVSRKWMAVAFAAVLVLFCVAGVIIPDRDYSPQENRFLTQWPALSRRNLFNGEYSRKLEKYLTDQFPLRDAWISLKAICQKLSGQKENNDVYFAADDYLIGKPLPWDPLIVRRNLDCALALSEKGYETALMVIPMASEILRDKLPAQAYEPEQAALLDKLKQEAGDMFIDLRPALWTEAEAGRQLYFRTDHHWTTNGAYEAYNAYARWLGLEPAPREAFAQKVVTEDFYGTLWSKNSLPGIPADRIVIYEPAESGQAYEIEFFDGSASWKSASMYQPEYLEQKDKYAYFLGQNRPIVVIRKNNASTVASTMAANESAEIAASVNEVAETASGAGKLLIFKDSYAHSLAPFLAQHFDEIHLVDLRYYKQDPIAYMEEHGIKRVLLLYNTDIFGTERSISQIGAYLARH